MDSQDKGKTSIAVHFPGLQLRAIQLGLYSRTKHCPVLHRPGEVIRSANLLKLAVDHFIFSLNAMLNFGLHSG